MNQITESDFFKNYSSPLLSRARARDNTCDLTSDDLKALWSRCGGCCEVTRHPFTKVAYKDCIVPHPFAPSVDRINCHLGYTKSNTRLVCVAVNFALNQWGDDVYFELVEAAVNNGKAAEFDRITQEWFGSREDALKAAEARLPTLDGEERVRMQRHLAGLKAAICKGPARARAAARNAWAARNEKGKEHSGTAIGSSGA